MNKLMVVLAALSLLVAGIVVLMPSPAASAPWISGTESYAAAWVNAVEQDLLKPEYRAVFLNDPRAPQAPVLHMLNRAAVAYDAHDITLAQDMVQRAIQVLEEGVRKQYYSKADIAPIISSIQKHVPFALRRASS
jgi:hypothetical protein